MGIKKEPQKHKIKVLQRTDGFENKLKRTSRN